jgi:membrane protein
MNPLTEVGAFALLKEAFTDWMEDKALRLSAALAYYSVFSIAPLLVIAIGIAGMVLGEEAVRGQLGDTLKGYVGPVAAEGVQEMVKNAAKPGQGIMATVIGFVTLLIGAGGVFGQLKDALNSIWEVKSMGGAGVTGFIRERLLSFGMVLVIGFLLLASLLATTAIAGLNHFLEARFALPSFVWTMLNFVVSIGLATTLFALIYKVLPDAKVEWRSVWVGAGLTALLFELGKFGLSYYLGRESTASSFGAAGSIVLLLLWVYYASCILFFGAEFTQVYARAAGHAIAPVEGAIVAGVTGRGGDCRKQPFPEPEKETLVTAVGPVELEEETTPPAGKDHVLGALFAVTGLSFLVGLFAQRRFEREQKPSTKLREGFSELGSELLTNLDAVRTRLRGG